MALGMKRGSGVGGDVHGGSLQRKPKCQQVPPRQGRTSKAYFSYMDTGPGFQWPPHTSQSPAQSRAQPTILTHGKTEGT